MTREEIIRRLADYYEIEPDEETGEYDLTDCDWTSGCRDFVTGKWLSLAEVVKALTE